MNHVDREAPSANVMYCMVQVDDYERDVVMSTEAMRRGQWKIVEGRLRIDDMRGRRAVNVSSITAKLQRASHITVYSPISDISHRGEPNRNRQLGLMFTL